LRHTPSAWKAIEAIGSETADQFSKPKGIMMHRGFYLLLQ